MLITVSGPAGSGKSTLAAGLADALSSQHLSGGDIFRSLADERGYSLVEFNKLAEDDDQIDRDLDRRLRTTAQRRDDLVLESRLAGWMAGEHADLRIWLDAPFDARIDRIADREDGTIEQLREAERTRAKSERQRYREYYGIDMQDRSIYDLVINTARWDADTTLDLVLRAVEAYDPASDEGKQPIEGVRYEF